MLKSFLTARLNFNKIIANTNPRSLGWLELVQCLSLTSVLALGLTGISWAQELQPATAQRPSDPVQTEMNRREMISLSPQGYFRRQLNRSWRNQAQPRLSITASKYWNSRASLFRPVQQSTNFDGPGTLISTGPYIFGTEATKRASDQLLGVNSIDLILQGSGWNGASDQDTRFAFRNVVTNSARYRLALLAGSPDAATEVFSISNRGNVLIGDFSVPSLAGSVALARVLNPSFDEDRPPLTVAGLIETLGPAGGVKFPDGTIQYTAAGALTSVLAGNGLTGGGASGEVTLGIAPGGITNSMVANNTLFASKIAVGQVVKSLNGLFDDITLVAGPNVTITPAGNTLTIAALGGGNSWLLGGNANTDPKSNFLGTTDNQPLVFRTNNAEALRLNADGTVGLGTSGFGAGLTVAGDNLWRSSIGILNTNRGMEWRLAADRSGSFIVTKVTGTTFTPFMAQENGNVELLSSETPNAKLTVNGLIENRSGGIKFPDGTVQTSAATNSATHDTTLTGAGTTAAPLGIALGGVSTPQLADNAVTNAKLADNAVSSAKIATGQVVKSLNVQGQPALFDRVTLAAGANIVLAQAGNTVTIETALADSSVHTKHLADDSVTDTKIHPGSVSNKHLADDSVTDTKIHPGSVGGKHLADGSVTGLKLATGSVGTSHLADSAIIGSKLADGSVTGLKLAAGAVSALHLADSSVTGSKLIAGAVSALHLADASITGSKLIDNAVSTAHLANGSVTGLKLAAKSVNSTHLMDSSVTDAKLVDAAVTSAKLAFGAVNTSHLADAVVTSAKLALGAVSTSHLADASVTGPKLVAGAVGTTHLADASVTGPKLVAGAVGTSHLADASVTGPKLATAAVSNAHLATGSVTATKIAAGQVVKSLNGKFDDVTLAAGANITITPVGNTLTIAATAGGTSNVTHNATLTGAGTSAAPLGVAVPLALSAANGAPIQTTINTGGGDALEASAVAAAKSALYAHHDGDAGYGVFARADAGTALSGLSASGFAMQSLGNARQSRDKGGWVKAIYRYAASSGSANLDSCFRGDEAANGATANSCAGFTRTAPGTGEVTITFPFTVNDRFVVITPQWNGANPVTVSFDFPAANQVRVHTWQLIGGTVGNPLTNVAFTLVVF